MGVELKTDGVSFGNTTLLGLLLERLARRNCNENENRRFFFSSTGAPSSFPFSFSVLERMRFIPVDALDLRITSSGSSEASREEGAESARA